MLECYIDLRLDDARQCLSLLPLGKPVDDVAAHVGGRVVQVEESESTVVHLGVLC